MRIPAHEMAIDREVGPLPQDSEAILGVGFICPARFQECLLTEIVDTVIIIFALVQIPDRLRICNRLVNPTLFGQRLRPELSI